MLKYIVTITIDSSIADEWKTWMLSKHIKDVMNTGCLTNFNFEIIKESHSEKNYRYKISYLSKSKQKLDEYFINFAPTLQKEHSEKYKDLFTAQREIIEEQTDDGS